MREQRANEFHCPWLRRNPMACENMPAGVDKVKEGDPCPHNAHAHSPRVFANRDAVSGSVERLFRLIGSADSGILNEDSMDPLSTTELLVTKTELQRQDNLRQKRQQEKARLEAEMNRERAANSEPGTMGGF